MKVLVVLPIRNRPSVGGCAVPPSARPSAAGPVAAPVVHPQLHPGEPGVDDLLDRRPQLRPVRPGSGDRGDHPGQQRDGQRRHPHAPQHPRPVHPAHVPNLSFVVARRHDNHGHGTR